MTLQANKGKYSSEIVSKSFGLSKLFRIIAQKLRTNLLVYDVRRPSAHSRQLFNRVMPQRPPQLKRNGDYYPQEDTMELVG